jgi:hypothetical protein
MIWVSSTSRTSSISSSPSASAVDVIANQVRSLVPCTRTPVFSKLSIAAHGISRSGAVSPHKESLDEVRAGVLTQPGSQIDKSSGGSPQHRGVVDMGQTIAALATNTRGS